MRIKVEIIVDMPDPSEWTTTFGTEGAADIRADVKSYIGNEVQQAGVFGNGEVTAKIDWK